MPELLESQKRAKVKDVGTEGRMSKHNGLKLMKEQLLI